MYWKTLPGWFWGIYYLFLLSTLGTAIFSIIRNKLKCLSVISIIFTITIPLFSITNSIGRLEGLNEFEHLINQLQIGSIWAIYVVIGMLYLFTWWALFFIKLRKQNKIK